MTVPINQKSVDMEVSIDDSNHLHGLVVNGSYRENNREGGLGPGDEKPPFNLSGLDDIPFLGRESSCDGEFFLGREASNSSLKLGRESSFDVGLAQIMVSADVHGFFVDLEQVDVQGDHQKLINSLDLQNFDEDEFARSPVKLPPPTPTPPSTNGAGVEAAPTEYNVVDMGDGEEEESNLIPTEAMRGSKRGAHVKDRPDMQKTARDGAVHWANQLKGVKAVWAARAATHTDFRDEFQSQIDRSFGRIRSKQECLLRVLQIAAADGVITPGPFGAGGFFGWTKFDVAPARAAEFRRTIEALFPPSFKEDTLKETFRRAGLVPERWQWHLGWTGRASWVFHARTRP